MSSAPPADTVEQVADIAYRAFAGDDAEPFADLPKSDRIGWMRVALKLTQLAAEVNIADFAEAFGIGEDEIAQKLIASRAARSKNAARTLRQVRTEAARKSLGTVRQYDLN